MKKFTLTNLQKKKNSSNWISLFLGLFVLMSINIHAQVTVTLGAGTDTSINDSTGSGLGPVNGYYAYMRYQVVYTADEIITAGGSAGEITEFGWNVATVPDVEIFPNYKVRMANTTAINSEEHNDADLTEVYNADFSPVAGYNMLTLDTPFFWDGFSNILIDVCYGEVDYTSSPFGQVYVYGSDSGSSRFARNDYSSRCNTSTSYSNAWKPQAQFSITPAPACSGTPIAGTIEGNLVNYLCTGTVPSPISVSGANIGAPGISYQWEESLNGTDWTDVTGGSGATTATYTPPAFDGTTVQYRFAVTCANSSETVYTDAVTIDNQIAPDTQASAVTVDSEELFSTSFIMDWTNGNGDRRMVVISDAAITDPADESGVPAIEANNFYAGTGQQIVYDGTSTSATIYGLTCNTSYFVKVYEYNRCGSDDVYSFYYNITEDTNATTITTAELDAAVSLPVSNDFSGFTGSNLITAVPGWYEAKRSTEGGNNPVSAYPGGITSSWGNSSVFGVTTARINLYYNEKNDWIISPKMEITADSRLIFDAAITNYSSLSADSDGMQGTDDAVNVLVSTDGCGVEWTPIYTFNAANTTELTNELTEYELLLTDYIGQTIQIAFQATDGPVDDGPDYDFHIGNIVVEEVPACDVPSLLATTAITKNSATIAWAAPLTGTPTGYEYVVSDTNATPTGAGTPTTELTANVESLISATDYFVFVRTDCGGSGYSEWTVAGTFTTLCDYPDLLTVSPDATVCGEETTTLSATSDGGTVKWYANATGGPALASGENFDTPALSETTTYYVASEVEGVATAGGGSAGTTSTSNTSALNYGLIFDAYSSFVLNSVDVYLASSSAGTIDLRLRNSAGNDILSASVSVPAGNSSTPVLHTINLGWLIPEGEDMRIVAISGPSMVREFSATVYPYAIGSVGAVTDGYSNGTINSTYYYFYNWNFTPTCSSPRVPVTVNVTEAPEIEMSEALAICFGEDAEISVTSDNADYTYNWMPGNLDGATQTVTPTETTTYTVTATDAVSGCVTTGTVTVTVNALPVVSIDPETIAVCEGGIEEITVDGAMVEASAVMGTGTTAPSTISFPNPFTAWYGGVKTQMIFKTAELEAQGLTAGATINSLSFDFFASVANTCNDLTIRIGNTTVEELTGGFISSAGLTTIYNADFTPVAGTTGLVAFNFNTSFVWNGDNIIVEVVHNQGNSGNGTGTRTRTTTTPFNSVYYGAKDGVTPAGAASLDALASADFTSKNPSTSRPNIVFNYEIMNTTVWSPIEGLYTDAEATVAYNGENLATVYIMPDAATTYTATVTNDAGCSASATVDVTISVVAAPTVDNATLAICNAGTVADLMATGDNIQWYADETGGTVLAIDAALADGTYYASQTVDGCESIARTAVAVTVNVIAAPTVDNATLAICNAGTVADLMATGDNIQWYADETGGTALANDTALADGTYYASQTVDGCESVARTAVAVTVNVIAAPTVDNATLAICNAGTVADLMATGDNIQWYADETGGTALASDAALADGTYYASQTVDGCESVARTAVAVTVNVIAAPTVDNTEVAICNAGTVADLMATGDNIQWYVDETGGTALANDAALADGTYYASQTVDGCESVARTAVAVTVNVIAAPTGDANQTITVADSTDATIEDIEVTAEAGAVVTWYASEEDAIAGENPIAAGTELTDGATYYATQTIDGCESDAVLAVTVGVVLGRDDFNIKTFSYYPNPVQDVLNISYDKEITSIAVYNLLGQQVMANTPNTTEVKLDMSILSDGTYLVTVTAGNTVKTIKVVKKQ